MARFTLELKVDENLLAQFNIPNAMPSISGKQYQFRIGPKETQKSIAQKLADQTVAQAKALGSEMASVHTDGEYASIIFNYEQHEQVVQFIEWCKANDIEVINTIKPYAPDFAAIQKVIEVRGMTDVISNGMKRTITNIYLQHQFGKYLKGV